MRRRLVRGLIATLLAVGVAVPASVQPAQAADVSDSVITLTFTALRISRGGLSAGEIETLVREVVGLTVQARNEVISHIDGHVAARALGEMDAFTIEFTNYEQFRHDQRWVRNLASRLISSASVDKRELDATQDDKAADAIGHALNVKYAMAEVAATDAGYTPESKSLLRQRYIQANEAILQKLEPECQVTFTDNDAYRYTRTWQCTAANGEDATATETLDKLTGQWINPPVNVEDLKLAAAVNSSWKVAKNILPTLKQP
ncbi:hypothetical protein RB614_35275 [Phytohabitans sp. ZYX-F-186]|uniref:DUF541 domain-containing protein n=1 Tax=Phytohabitans maris TaxID=3071409 RepID=A0ABU0ZTY3_9ACTN|nr:hypothetical protein [Phytohabitans sp. ZYX-F-186]MDQ7909774.1 hypothetical protein [Phytohabitans sp. ZYX-F-186]